MAKVPRITESNVRAWVDARSFERGNRYFAGGRIQQPRRQDDVLKAECAGSMPRPYRVEATLNDGRIVAAECSCPVGLGGHCKHVAALLLTWVHEPEAFSDIEDTDEMLAQRSKEDLITLIKRMLARHPDLEDLLMLPTAGAITDVDVEQIERQVAALIERFSYEYDYAYGYGGAFELQRELRPILDLGKEYLALDDWRNAAAVFAAVPPLVLDAYEAFHDEEGHIHVIIDECIEHLQSCLQRSNPDDPGDAAARRDIFRVLLDVRQWDVNFGGIDMGYEAHPIILEEATAAEKAEIVQWVQEAMPPDDDDSWSTEWRRQAYGAWLLDLQADTLDDETYLRICRESGRTSDLVNRLLELDRVDEAVHEAQEAGDYTLLQLADLFVRHGHEPIAADLLWERNGTSDDRRLQEWLKQHAIRHEDWAEALRIATSLFWQRPSREGYKEIRELASQVQRWDQERANVLARLEREEEFDLLTEIHLLENNVALAMETVRQARTTKRSGWAIYNRQRELDVAQAAEAEFPREAIKIYEAEVRRLIDARGRDNYATAASYLQRVKALYQERLDEPDAWRALAAELRDQKPRLPALLDEMKKAGL